MSYLMEVLYHNFLGDNARVYRKDDSLYYTAYHAIWGLDKYGGGDGLNSYCPSSAVEFVFKWAVK